MAESTREGRQPLPKDQVKILGTCGLPSVVLIAMERRAAVKSESHETPSEQRVGRFIACIGIAFLISSLVINPWVGRFWRKNIVNYHDVMLDYFICISISGALLIGIGLLYARVRVKMIGNLAALLTTLSLFLASDRLLLTAFGLPLWVPDIENHYRHRSNAVRSWGPGYDNKLIRINDYGHHDDDFPRKKLHDEFRGIILGDSIAMGHGVTREETFSTQLEALLAASRTKYNRFQIINTGVQGYSTFQEYHMLERSLIFEPRFIAIGFCMNDVTEPFVVNRNFGGVGVDYHGVMQTSNFLAGYLVNETGYGRLLQKWRSRTRSKAVEQRWSIHSIKYLASHPTSDPETADLWSATLTHLQSIYDIAKRNNIEVVLLIFPYTFQLMDDGFKIPQRVLIDHARQAGATVMDFTQIFEELVFDEPVVRFLRENDFSYDDIRDLYKARLGRYFLDQLHYTPEGHRIIASRLLGYLRTQVL